jgi:hypothetical protein
LLAKRLVRHTRTHTHTHTLTHTHTHTHTPSVGRRGIGATTAGPAMSGLRKTGGMDSERPSAARRHHFRMAWPATFSQLLCCARTTSLVLRLTYDLPLQFPAASWNFRASHMALRLCKMKIIHVTMLSVVGCPVCSMALLSQDTAPLTALSHVCVMQDSTCTQAIQLTQRMQASGTQTV